MKKMKREMEPMVFRSFRTPGLERSEKNHEMWRKGSGGGWKKKKDRGKKMRRDRGENKKHGVVGQRTFN